MTMAVGLTLVGTVGVDDQLDAVAGVAVGVLEVGAGVPLVRAVVLGAGNDGLEGDGVGGRALQQNEGDGAAGVGSVGIPLDVVALASGDDLSALVSWKLFRETNPSRWNANTTATQDFQHGGHMDVHHQDPGGGRRWRWGRRQRGRGRPGRP